LIDELNGRLELLEMSVSDNIIKQLEGTLNNYVSALVANIEKRFPDIPILETLVRYNI